MIRAFTLRSLAVRWPRLVGSLLIVAFGVGSVTGTLVFADTTRAVFGDLFRGLDGGAAVIVSGRDGAPVPARAVRLIRRTAGVTAALGQLELPATIVAPDGRPVPPGRLPTEAISMVSPPFTGVRIIAGRAPHGPGEVALDAATAARERWRIGSLVAVLTGQPARRFRLVGIAARSPAGQRFVVFSLGAEQRLYGRGASADRVLVAVAPRTPVAALAARLRRRLGPGVAVRVDGGAVALAVSRVSGAFASLNADLLAFALAAVLLGGLTILGTFLLSAAQRQREFALLRALGASRLQVLASGLTEGLLVGGLGAILGLLLGPLVVLLIRGLLAGSGFSLPSGGLVIAARTLGIGAAVGVGVSLLAAAWPALRATRAAPLAAVRAAAAVEVPTEGRVPRALRALLALGLIGGGVTVMLLASGSDTRRLEVCAGGGALLVAGTLLLGPFLVRLGAALWRLAARLRMRREEPGAVGRLAREQLRTHPGRTALSGATLMIGVGLAIVIGVYVGGLRAASEAAIREAVVGDLAIESADGTSSMPGTVVRAAVTVPDAAAVSTLKRATAILAPGGPVPVNGVDPTSWGEVYRFDWLAGSTSSLADLAPGQVLVESDTARAHGLSLGSPVILTVSGGRRVGARVAGVYRDAGLLHGLTVPLAWFDQLFAVTRLQGVFLRLSGAVAPQVALATLRGALRGYPGVVVHNQDGLAAQLRARLGGIVRLLYALLGLTVVMSLLGLGAALTLSVTTRTRELGVLRALGMTPGQARRLIRLEGLFSAAVAGLTGLALGAVVSAALLRALRVEGFVLVFPWAPLAAALGVMVAVAVLATVGPARRAARADILAAIAYE